MGVHQKFLREPQQVGIIAASFHGGQPKKGVESGPKHMLDLGLVDQLRSLGWSVSFSLPDKVINTEKNIKNDININANNMDNNANNMDNINDLKQCEHASDGFYQTFEHFRPLGPDHLGKLKNASFVSRAAESVAHQVNKIQKEGGLALTIGGDHSIGLGTVAGSCMTFRGQSEVCVIWVDAHADINTHETTLSGNLHGCPVSFLLGLSTPLPHFEWVPSLPTPFLNPHRIAYIGLRDVDDGEKRILKENNIKAFSMHEVDKFGIGKVVEMALDHVNPDRTLPIHLSFDVDALDPSVAPATGTPVRGGLTFREGHYICEALHETGLLVAVDLMEVNPALGDEKSFEETVKVGCSLVRSAMGETLL